MKTIFSVDGLRRQHSTSRSDSFFAEQREQRAAGLWMRDSRNRNQPLKVKISWCWSFVQKNLSLLSNGLPCFEVNHSSVKKQWKFNMKGWRHCSFFLFSNIEFFKDKLPRYLFSEKSCNSICNEMFLEPMSNYNLKTEKV